MLRIDKNMAKFHNCTDKYLWNKGVLPLLKWVCVGFFGYVLIFILHKPIVSLKNTTLTLIWMMFTLVLLYIWKRSGKKQDDLIHNWSLGYCGEWRTGRELKKLPNDFKVFYDVHILGLGGNIDFVVVSSHGVYAVEVKNVKCLNWMRKNMKQAGHAAGLLQKALADLNISYVTPVLVYASRYKVEQPPDDNVYVIGRKEIFESFTKTIPLRRDCKYSSEEIYKIVRRIDSLVLDFKNGK